MEKQIIKMLTEIQSEMKEFRSELAETRSELKETRTDVKDIKNTVHRIETAQTEDVIAMLKVTSKNSESDFHYLNTRITNIDKRVFNLESRADR
ncbi:hypothetical protein [Falsibacillus pallidus]|uniref:hypothetical protein n=1 Tax=Falsibacillus pallidus TaxID=493781 RepID=UPI003D96579A